MDAFLKSIIPELTPEQQELFDKNQLCFKGNNLENKNIRQLELIPSEAVGYWFAFLRDLNSGIEDYLKRPVIADGLRFLWGIDKIKFDLKPEKCKPWPVDYMRKEEERLKNKIIKKKEITNIYFIQAEIGGPIKIGESKSMDFRLKQHQTGSPFILKIIKVIENVPLKTERELHKKFSKYRLHGEWFSEDILKEI